MSSNIAEFVSTPSTTTLHVNNSAIIVEKQTLAGLASLAGIETITTALLTATISGTATYASGPMVVPPGGVLWGVRNGEDSGREDQSGAKSGEKT